MGSYKSLCVLMVPYGSLQVIINSYASLLLFIVVIDLCASLCVIIGLMRAYGSLWVHIRPYFI